MGAPARTKRNGKNENKQTRGVYLPDSIWLQLVERARLNGRLPGPHIRYLIERDLGLLPPPPV